jgi:DNA gyrase subunit A
MGVKTITLTESKGALAGALVVREHEELLFISANGMVQRTSVRGINRYGRASQGVRLMNLKEDDVVSAVALVVDADDETDGQNDGDATGAADAAASNGHSTNGAVAAVDIAVLDGSLAEDDEPDDDEDLSSGIDGE